MQAEHQLALMSNSQVLATFGAKLHVSAVRNTASGLPINVEGHFCKMLTVQAVPTAQCLRLGPTESASQSFSAVRYIIDAHKYAKGYYFVGCNYQTPSVTEPLTGTFHGDNARTVWRVAEPRLTRCHGSAGFAELTGAR